MSAAEAIGRLLASPRPRVLLVAHAFGGGVARHVAELARAIEPNAEALLLQPHLDSSLALRWVRRGEDLTLWFHAGDEWDRLLALLRSIGVDLVHYHHVHGLPQSILELPHALQCPHDLTLHDYFPACPAYHLLDAAGRYCGGGPQCRKCLDEHPAQWSLTIEAWRAAFGDLLRRARRVIAPSRDAARRIRDFFPGVSPVVWPHPESRPPVAPAPTRVLVPGAIAPAKGLEVLESCLRDAAARDLPLHFRVLGYLARPIGEWGEARLGVTGEYREGRLEALIALERGDVLFFPAQCPETFSYTLSDALDTSLPIVATDLGALPERLAGRENARLLPWDASAGAMNDALLAFRSPAPAESHEDIGRMTPRSYATLYLEGIRRSERPRSSPPSIEPRWLREPRASPTPSSLAWLFDDAVRCGRASSLEELRRRTAEADARLETAADERARLARQEERLACLQAQLEEACRERDHVAASLEAREGMLRTIESSRSWKITAPLRSLARRLRSAR